MCASHRPVASPAAKTPPAADPGPSGGPPATALDHVGLSVRDLEAAISFYRNAFGLAEEFRFTVDGAGMTAVVLRSEDGWAVELMHRSDSVDPVARYAQPDEAVRNRGYGHLCVRVQELETVFERLLAAGATVVVPPGPARHPAVRFSYVADPEGNLLELVHFRAGVDLAAPA
jgi:catechol 2,3-dioxygenase-like lactoylglutathione lyase family enzyme